MMSSAPAKSVGDARYVSQDPFIYSLIDCPCTILTSNAITCTRAFFLRTLNPIRAILQCTASNQYSETKVLSRNPRINWITLQVWIGGGGGGWLGVGRYPHVNYKMLFVLITASVTWSLSLFTLSVCIGLVV